MNEVVKKLLYCLAFIIWLLIVLFGGFGLYTLFTATFGTDGYVTGMVMIFAGVVAIVVPAVIVLGDD